MFRKLLPPSKGNVITIENKDILKQKTLEFLNRPQFEKLKTDPTNRFQQDLKKAIKESNNIMNQKISNSYINSNPKAPKLRTTTKIHKENFPIRPIVNYRSAPAYRIKKHLIQILKSHLIIENTYNIKNTKSLIELLKHVKISNNTKLISLDISDMYTNVPVKYTDIRLIL